MSETKLWIARSKPFGNCENGMVHLFDDKPYRYNNGFGMEYWRCDSPYIMGIIYKLALNSCQLCLFIRKFSILLL